MVRNTKEEAYKKFAELMVQYKSENKTHTRSFNTDYFDRNAHDLKDTLNKKYKFKKIIKEKDKIQCLFTDESCLDKSCMKGFYFEIDTSEPLNVCQVNRVHKETKEKSAYYEISSFFVLIAFYDPVRKGMDVSYVLIGLTLEEKEKMDEILGLLKIIYNPDFVCK